MKLSSQSAIGPITVLSLVPSYVLSQPCAATSQNPHCDPSFSNLICCPYPNVCYWADRQKTPGCCPQGQVCGVGGGGGVVTPTPEPGTTITAPAPEPEKTITATAPAPESEITFTAPAPAPETTITTADQPTCSTALGGAVETVTSGVVGVWSTVTAGAIGVYSTVTSGAVGVFVTAPEVLVGRAAPTAEVGWSVVLLPLIISFWTLAGAAGFYLGT